MAPSPARTPPNARVAELDALRGLAALAVGLFHLTYFVPFMIPGARRATVAFWWGCYGVQLFFAISGFVILATLERTQDVRRFARARAVRLFPEYWMAMAITAGVAALIAPPALQVDAVTWLRNLPLMQLWTGTRMVDGVYWSLTVEVSFYAGMALAWRLGLTRRIELLVLGWLVVRWILWAIGAPAWLQLLLLTEQAAYFSIGLIAYRVWTGERRWTEQLLVLATLGATVFLLDPIHSHLLYAGMAPLFLALAAGRLHLLAQPVLVWMGRVSYPFYLLHAVIGYSVIYRLGLAGIGPGAASLIALLVAGLAATAVERLCEHGRRMARATAPTGDQLQATSMSEEVGTAAVAR